MTWNPNEEPVDYVELAGQRTPGLAEIIGAGSPRQWDEARGPGLSGARLRFRGLRLSRFMIRIRLFTTQDFADWEAFRSVVQRPPLGERPRAIDIVHPITTDAGINSVVVEDVSQMTQTDDGEWTIEIKLIEHRPPLPAAAVIDGSSQATTDPLDLEIEALSGTLSDALAAEADLSRRAGA